MNATTKHGYIGIGYVDPCGAETVIAAQLGAHPAATVMRWLGKRDTLAELRLAGSPALVDWAMALEHAIAGCSWSPREADVFHARYERQLSIGETAALLGIARQTVNTYCRRIANKIAKRMGGDLC